jgi:hypothetical protein
MFYCYSAILWAEKVGIKCSFDSARILFKKYLCSYHFLESDFTTTEKIHLNKVAVPCGSDLAGHSIPQPSFPSLYIPPLDSFPSVLTHEGDLHVLRPTKTYSKASVTSSPIHTESPSTSSQIPALQVSPTAANTFAVEETSFTPSSIKVNACDGELRHINCPSSSSKPTARHSLLKELNLASFSELTPRKRKLYECIRNKESVLCKLKKKYKAKKLKKLSSVDSDPLMENLSSSLSVEAARILAAIIRNSI